MLRDMLTLRDSVTVTKTVGENDGNGTLSTGTAATTLGAALIWQAGSSNRFIGELVAKTSTHVLAIETGEYTFSGDEEVTYNSETYKVVGYPDDVAKLGEITVIGLERIYD